jgi:hypothetical protein
MSRQTDKLIRQNERLRTENQAIQSYHSTKFWSGAVRTATRWTGGCFIAYFTYLSVEALAGRTTLANIAVNFIGNLTVSKSLAYLFGAGGAGYGLYERKKRQRAVGHMHGHNKSLESIIDSRRSSSGLTRTGETNPLDAD